MVDQIYYRDRAEHFLRLAAISPDAETADLLRAIAADFFDLANASGVIAQRQGQTRKQGPDLHR
jgi:hypothetical protein